MLPRTGSKIFSPLGMTPQNTSAIFPPTQSRDNIPNLFTVRAEIITELIMKRAGPVIFKTFLLELIAFRPIPVICPARGVSLKITGNDNYFQTGPIPQKKSVIFQKLIPGNIFPDPL